MLLSLFGGPQADTPTARALPKVQVNRYFISDAEAAFFRVLNKVVAGQAHVLAQVSVRQLLWFPGNQQDKRDRATWQNKVAAKSVDFVLCDPASLRPLVAIELDDSSHTRPERQSRDAEVEALFAAAGLPLLRVPTSRAYDTRALAAALQPHMAPSPPRTA